MRTKICFVCSGGGHLTELLEFIDYIKIKNRFLVCCDHKYKNVDKKFNKVYFIAPPLISLKNFLVSIFKTLSILFFEKLNIIISTGGEISILFFYFGKIFLHCKTIYVECSAQVYNPSITGTIVYLITDLFLVQWEPLLKKYGKKAKFVGGLI